MTHVRACLLLAAFCSAAAAAPVEPAEPPPRAAARPVSEELFGTTVVDRFRYMESRDPETTDWMKAQGRYTRDLLDRIAPRADYLQRMSAFGGRFGVADAAQPAGGRVFYRARPPGADVFKLYVAEGGRQRLLIDTDAVIRAAGNTPHAIDWLAPSPDGSKVAVGISSGGSENSVMTVLDTASGRTIAGPVDRAQFGSVSWFDDGSGLFFLRQQPTAMADGGAGRYKNSSVHVWDLRHETAPVTGPGTGLGPIREEDLFPAVVKVPHRDHVLLLQINGVQPELAMWRGSETDARAGRQNWQPLLDVADGVTRFGVNRSTLYLMSHRDAPTFKVLALPVGAPMGEARVVVPARAGRVIENIAAASDGLYVAAREGLWSRLLHVDERGTVREVALPYEASIGELSADPDRPGAVVSVQSWTRPTSHLRYEPARRRFVDLDLDIHPPVDAARYAATTLHAVAKDGTRVPLSVLSQAGPPTPRPTLLSAYGAYGIPIFPYFSPRSMAFVDAGANNAVCHVRGGGELGEAWRLGGKGPTKANTWGDFAACAESLIAAGYTTAEMLTIEGTSAGGIAVGRAATDRPELFAGAIARVGDVNALRMETMPAGPANIPEFGSVKTEAGFRGLYAMDVIQHVRDGVRYPAFLITGGFNDPRVEPWEGAKLAARLQELAGGRPALYRLEESAGHGLGTTKSTRDAEEADIAAFVFWRAGSPAWQPKP